jgi:hypothetical protein
MKDCCLSSFIHVLPYCWTIIYVWKQTPFTVTLAWHFKGQPMFCPTPWFCLSPCPCCSPCPFCSPCLWGKPCPCCSPCRALSLSICLATSTSLLLLERGQGPLACPGLSVREQVVCAGLSLRKPVAWPCLGDQGLVARPVLGVEDRVRWGLGGLLT